MAAHLLEDPKAVYSVKIIGREVLNHDTILFRLELPSEKHILGTKSGQHFLIIATINGEKISRKYTPTTLEDQQGFFEFIIKIYRPCEKFPDGGKLGPYLENLNIDDYMDIQGPIGRCTYLHNGLFEYKHEKSSPLISKKVNKIGFVAGGSGITPFLQIIKTICHDKSDDTKVSLIFANNTEDDIITRKELEELQLNNPDKFKIWYTVTKSIYPDWNYSEGFVNEEIIKKHLPAPESDVLVMVCGPKPMVWQCVMPILDSIGYTKDMLFKY
ncbi:unnamed protein product [Brachionus calyciflorus]|uniref:NADH-cytochrome b5 reductase n=1 Tax=Brachionus calyciflorus TaxID=104777 RepID=A0A814BRH5_9BILA|nr:unnamed protein product [Brachionus calyciflorus]